MNHMVPNPNGKGKEANGELQFCVTSTKVEASSGAAETRGTQPDGPRWGGQTGFFVGVFQTPVFI